MGSSVSSRPDAGTGGESMRSAQTIADATAFIKAHHLIVFHTSVVMAVPGHCEACGEPIAVGKTAYIWQSPDMELWCPFTYRLDGFCDVIAFRLTKQFVIALKHALFNPDEDIPGWPARSAQKELHDDEGEQP
jgi:hypothetical protein